MPNNTSFSDALHATSTPSTVPCIATRRAATIQVCATRITVPRASRCQSTTRRRRMAALEAGYAARHPWQAHGLPHGVHRRCASPPPHRRRGLHAAGCCARCPHRRHQVAASSTNPAVGWDPSAPNLLISVLASDVRLALRALRDYCDGMGVAQPTQIQPRVCACVALSLSQSVVCHRTQASSWQP